MRIHAFHAALYSVLLISVAGPAWAGGAASTSWATAQYNNQRIGYNAREHTLNGTNVAKLKVKWSASLPGIANAQPVVVGNELYLGCWNGILYAVNTGTGQTAW